MQFIPNIIVSVKIRSRERSGELPEKEEFHGILRNIGAMSFHKLGTVIVRNTDSLLMSNFFAVVGIYSNYKLILSGINNLMDKFSNAFTGSLGIWEPLKMMTGVQHLPGTGPALLRHLLLDSSVRAVERWLRRGILLLHGDSRRPRDGILCFGQRKVTCSSVKPRAPVLVRPVQAAVRVGHQSGGVAAAGAEVRRGRHSGRNGHQHRDDLPLDGALHPDALRHPGRLAGQTERLLCPLRRTRRSRRRWPLSYGWVSFWRRRTSAGFAGRCAVYAAVRGCHSTGTRRRSAQGPCPVLKRRKS